MRVGGNDVIVAYCECGTELTGRQKVWCKECAIMAHPGSSQCPFCKEWYYTHSGNVTQSILEHHAKKHCRKG